MQEAIRKSANDFDGALFQGVQEVFTVVFSKDSIIEDCDNSFIGLSTDEPAGALLEF